MENNKIIYLSPDKLIEYDNNIRLHDEEQINQICRSIREFGFTNPILIDENNIIIAGHGRKAAAIRLGLKTIPAIRLSGLTDKQIKALRIADNKLALNAGWDDELLKFEILSLQESDFDLELLGFSGDEIDSFLVAEEEIKEEGELKCEEAKEKIPNDFKTVEETKLVHRCPRCNYEFND